MGIPTRKLLRFGAQTIWFLLLLAALTFFLALPWSWIIGRGWIGGEGYLGQTLTISRGAFAAAILPAAIWLILLSIRAYRGTTLSSFQHVALAIGSVLVGTAILVGLLYLWITFEASDPEAMILLALPVLYGAFHCVLFLLVAWFCGRWSRYFWLDALFGLATTR